MTTREMVNVALRLAGLEEDTVDTEIGCEGTCIKRVLAGIDMEIERASCRERVF